LARLAGIDLPVQARKRSVFYVQCPEQLPGCPMVIDPSGAYFRPEGQGFITGIAPPPDQDPECFDFDVQHALFEDVLWPLLAQRGGPCASAAAGAPPACAVAARPASPGRPGAATPAPAGRPARRLYEPLLPREPLPPPRLPPSPSRGDSPGGRDQRSDLRQRA